MAVCEQPRFWRWLAQGFVEKIRAVPGFIGGLIGGIRSPIFEMLIGITGIFASLILPLIILGVTLTTKAIIALCFIPSFLIMMHGIYREDDC